jgi:uncharacterized protein (TIGR00730 family)
MRIAVFCGSRAGNDPAFESAARELGQEMARRGIGLVYGGTGSGLMRVVSQAAREGGGEVIGVIATGLGEVADPDVADMRVVETLSQRKLMMADLCDAFVTLPGGLGTLDEWSEAVTWGMIGLHQKPVAVLNTSGYYDDFLRFLDRAVREGFWKSWHRDALIVETSPQELLQVLGAAPNDAPTLGEQ